MNIELVYYCLLLLFAHVAVEEYTVIYTAGCTASLLSLIFSVSSNTEDKTVKHTKVHLFPIPSLPKDTSKMG